MKNRTKLLIITLLAMTMIAISAVAVNASTVASGKCGDNLTWTLSSDRVLTINGKGPMYDYKISEDEDDEDAPWCDAPWYALSYKEFDDDIKTYDEDFDEYYNDSLGTLNKVIISEGVTSIGDYAFEGLEIGSISLPSTIETIGKYAIAYWCHNTIELPKNLRSIGAYGLCAFDFDNIHIPAGLESIGPGAISCSSFSLDKNNTKFTIVNGVLFSKDKKTLVLYPKYKKGKTYTVPNGTESIGTGAFINCEHIQTLKIPEGVKTLEKYSVLGTWNMKKVYLPKSLKTIKNYAFAYDWGDESPERLTIYYAGTKENKKNISVTKKYNERLYDGAKWKYSQTIGEASIKLNKSTLSLIAGNSATLKATLTNCSGTVSWKSSDTSIATVSKGTVKGKKKGTATITASVKYAGKTYKKTCKVTVKKTDKVTASNLISPFDTNLSFDDFTLLQKGTFKAVKASDNNWYYKFTYQKKSKYVAVESFEKGVIKNDFTKPNRNLSKYTYKGTDKSEYIPATYHKYSGVNKKVDVATSDGYTALVSKNYIEKTYTLYEIEGLPNISDNEARVQVTLRGMPLRFTYSKYVQQGASLPYIDPADIVDDNVRASCYAAALQRSTCNEAIVPQIVCQIKNPGSQQRYFDRFKLSATGTVYSTARLDSFIRLGISIGNITANPAKLSNWTSVATNTLSLRETSSLDEYQYSDKEQLIELQNGNYCKWFEMNSPRGLTASGDYFTLHVMTKKNNPNGKDDDWACDIEVNVVD